MNTNSNTDRDDDLLELGRLAARWLKIRRRWAAAHSAYEAITNDGPIARRRKAEFRLVEKRLEAIESRLYSAAYKAGAVMPRSVQVGNLLVTIRPDPAEYGDGEHVIVLDLRRRVSPATA